MHVDDLIVGCGCLVAPVRKVLFERVGAGTTDTYAAPDLRIVEANIPVRRLSVKQRPPALHDCLRIVATAAAVVNLDQRDVPTDEDFGVFILVSRAASHIAGAHFGASRRVKAKV